MNETDNDFNNEISGDSSDLNFNAKKSLGQNFLHAPNIISAMVKTGDVNESSNVLEIGPGKGALTIKLLEAGANVIAIEKDDRAIPFLQEKFENYIKNGKLTLIHGDILEFEKILSRETLERFADFTIIANIPYYITGELLRKLLENPISPRKIVIMVQKEVAKRVVDQKESILSISVKVYGEPKYICTVSRKLFRPMPNVDSAVISIENISKKFFNESNIDEKYFFEVLKAGFAHKRKILIRNLENVIDKEKLEKIWLNEKIPHDARAENINVEMWKKIVGDTSKF